MRYVRKRRLKDGSVRWLVQVYVGRDGTSKPKFAHKTFRDKDAAEAHAHQVLADRKRGAALPTAGRVNELLDDLLYDQRVKRRKNLKGAERVVRKHLRPYFGNLRVERVTTAVIRKYIDRRQVAGAADATINNNLAALRRAFNLGYQCTPPKVVRVPYFPMLTVNNARRGFFEAEEYAALFAELAEEIRPVFAFGYYTGCRKGEILMLLWTQVDLVQGLVRLNPGETKNDEGRVIPLVPELLEILRMQKALRDQYWPQCPWVFFRHASSDRIKSFRTAWRLVCKRAGLWDAETQKPTKLFHDLRRTGVRNLIRAGVPEKIAMAISGHKTRSVFDRYNIVSERDLLEAARRLGEYTRERQPVKLPVKLPAENAPVN